MAGAAASSELPPGVRDAARRDRRARGTAGCGRRLASRDGDDPASLGASERASGFSSARGGRAALRTRGVFPAGPPAREGDVVHLLVVVPATRPSSALAYGGPMVPRVAQPPRSCAKPSLVFFASSRGAEPSERFVGTS